MPHPSIRLTTGAPSATASAAKRYSRSRPYLASLAAVQGLCTITDKSADKDTVRVSLDLGDSGLVYSPGDALGVYPTNEPEVSGWLQGLMTLWV